jgi:hypothetical protein
MLFALPFLGQMKSKEDLLRQLELLTDPTSDLDVGN